MAPGFGDSSTTTKATVTILVLNKACPCGKKPSAQGPPLAATVTLCGCCHEPAHLKSFLSTVAFSHLVSAK